MTDTPDDANRSAALPDGVHRIEFPVDWRPGHVAAYLLTGPEPVLVDAGVPGPEGREALTDGLAAAGYAVADVAHLVVTHPHVDHVGQVETVVDAAAPTVYAPAATRERFGRDAESFRERTEAAVVAAGVPPERRDRLSAWLLGAMQTERDLLAADAVDVGVEPGEMVTVGDRSFEPIHAPGHQSDQLCYMTAVGGRRVLLAGDAAIAPFRPVLTHAWLRPPVTDAASAYRRTLDALAELSVDRVLPGHGPVHADLAGAVAGSRRSLDALLDGTADAVAGGVETAFGLASRRADGERALGYLLPEAVAALAAVERTGRVAATTDEDGVRRHRPG